MAKHYPKSRSHTTSHCNKALGTQQITERELQQDLRELIGQAEQAKTLTAMVTLLMVGLRVLGLKLIRLTLERRDDDLHRHRQGPPSCPRCGRKLRKPRRKWTTRVTLLGKLRYQRRSWLCPHCHKSHQPLDGTLDLVVMYHGQSLEFVRELTLLCTLHAFEQGCALFEGKQKASKGEGDWRDVRALLLYREADLASCSKGRRKILHRRVLAHVGTQDQWRQLLHLAFHEQGVYLAREVVVVADGGAGIWDTIDKLLPSTRTRKVTQILDWCHAASYLWKVAKKWKRGNRRKDVQARAKWVDGLVVYLANGKVANVLQRLKRLQRGKTGGLFDEIRRCLDYLEEHRGRMHYEEHRGRMHYPRYRKDGMTIGSGAIESVHKWVIQARCKQAGMAWSEASVDAMLRLRCVWASGRWDEIFTPPDTDDEKKLNDSLFAAAA